MGQSVLPLQMNWKINSSNKRGLTLTLLWQLLTSQQFCETQDSPSLAKTPPNATVNTTQYILETEFALTFFIRKKTLMFTSPCKYTFLKHLKIWLYITVTFTLVLNCQKNRLTEHSSVKVFNKLCMILQYYWLLFTVFTEHFSFKAKTTRSGAICKSLVKKRLCSLCLCCLCSWKIRNRLGG